MQWSTEMPTPAYPLPPPVLDALRRGNTIEAIKLLRTATGLGLGEAKALIDVHQRSNPVPHPVSAGPVSLGAALIDALQKGNKIEAIRLLREQTGLGLKAAKDATYASGRVADPLSSGLSPGEVPRSSKLAWMIALAIAALTAYHYLDF
jgi:hypothetical protein